MVRILAFLRRASSHEHFGKWAACSLIADAVLTALIIRRIPFTNVDWEAYTSQVDQVLGGQFDYAELRGPTGPIAYPAGFCWFYGGLRVLGVGIGAAQVLFAGIYLSTVAAVLALYWHAGAPGWLAPLCVLSKRMHSVFVLRMFNDPVATLLSHLALLLFLRDRLVAGSVLFSAAVSVKMHPLLHCPAAGLMLVAARGWRGALPLVALMAGVQALLAAPFLAASPLAYLSRAFGGPGDLQHEWSVNWRMIPEPAFRHPAFGRALASLHVLCLLWFAHFRWVPGGLLSRDIWRWSGPPRHLLDARGAIAVWLACGFVGVVFMRTMHFQFLAWYFHAVPFLAWHALEPEGRRGPINWAARCAGVVVFTACIEVAFLTTGTGTVRGPDGRQWETDGVPTARGSMLLTATHAALLVAVALRGQPAGADAAVKKAA